MRDLPADPALGLGEELLELVRHLGGRPLLVGPERRERGGRRRGDARHRRGRARRRRRAHVAHARRRERARAARGRLERHRRDRRRRRGRARHRPVLGPPVSASSFLSSVGNRRGARRTRSPRARARLRRCDRAVLAAEEDDVDPVRSGSSRIFSSVSSASSPSASTSRTRGRCTATRATSIDSGTSATR